MPEEQERIRVLLVEDDKVDRLSLRRFIRREGLPYDVTEATSGAEAGEALKRGAFDVVLVDFLLGDATGLDVMRDVHDAPVVFVTGSGSEEIAAEAMRRGAYDYLVKDPQRNYLQVLPSTIRSVLERKRLEQEKDRLIAELQRALSEVKTLRGIVPICAKCKRIRDDNGFWQQVEVYVRDHSEAEFSHGLCEECCQKLYQVAR